MILDTLKKGRFGMARKLYTLEQIIGKLRAIEVHISIDLTAQQAARREVGATDYASR